MPSSHSGQRSSYSSHRMFPLSAFAGALTNTHCCRIFRILHSILAYRVLMNLREAMARQSQTETSDLDSNIYKLDLDKDDDVLLQLDSNGAWRSGVARKLSLREGKRETMFVMELPQGRSHHYPPPPLPTWKRHPDLLDPGCEWQRYSVSDESWDHTGRGGWSGGCSSSSH
jgi:hypothetical protein